MTRSKSTKVGLIALALAATGFVVAGCSSGANAGGSAAAEALDGNVVGTVSTPGTTVDGACLYYGPTTGYSDIDTGANVVIKDEADVTVGAGTLGTPTFKNSLGCQFPFTTQVGPAKFYHLTIGQREGPTVTEADLKADNWKWAVQIGDAFVQPLPDATPTPAPTVAPRPTAAPTATPTATATPTPRPSKVVLNLKGDVWDWEPWELTAPADVPITVHFHNTDKAERVGVGVWDEHGSLILPNKDIKPGKTHDYDLGPLPAGTYTLGNTLDTGVTLFVRD